MEITTSTLAVSPALTAMGSRLFFSANDGVRGRELWKSDGTGGGTALVKDIDPALDPSDYPGSYPTSFRPSGGQLFFAASDGTGSALWASDGSAEGTSSPRSTTL